MSAVSGYAVFEHIFSVVDRKSCVVSWKMAPFGGGAGAGMHARSVGRDKIMVGAPNPDDSVVVSSESDVVVDVVESRRNVLRRSTMPWEGVGVGRGPCFLGRFLQARSPLWVALRRRFVAVGDGVDISFGGTDLRFLSFFAGRTNGSGSDAHGERVLIRGRSFCNLSRASARQGSRKR